MKFFSILLLFSLLSFLPSGTHAILHGIVSEQPRHLAVQKTTLQADGICTGTFISPRVYVTAAHCVRSGGAKQASGPGRTLRLSVAGMKPTRYRIFPGTLNSQDIAILDFPDNRSVPYLHVSTTPPQPGDAVELVGFGFTTPKTPSTGGVRRAAWNRLAQKLEHQLVLQWIVGTSPPSGMTLTGDSGGPLLDRYGRLIGIANQNSPHPVRLNHRPTQLSSFVDLTDPEIRRFIIETTRAWKTPVPSLPDHPPALLSRPVPRAQTDATAAK